MNQRLSNLELQVKKGEENRKDLEKRFEFFCAEFQENKLEFKGHLNSRLEDDSFTSSSFDVQRRDSGPRGVVLTDLTSGKSTGKA